MFYPTVQQVITGWLPKLSINRLQCSWRDLAILAEHCGLLRITLAQKNAPERQVSQVQQIQLHPSESYDLNAGEYMVKVLAGRIWIPEMGIFGAPEQVRLTAKPGGFSIRTVQSTPVVFELCSIRR